MTLHEQLRSARIAAGLTQQEVADRMGSNLPEVSRLENGKGNPTLSYITRYCDAIGVTLKFHITQGSG